MHDFFGYVHLQLYRYVWDNPGVCRSVPVHLQLCRYVWVNLGVCRSVPVHRYIAAYASKHYYEEEAWRPPHLLRSSLHEGNVIMVIPDMRYASYIDI